MYSKTSITFMVEPFVAGIEMRCPYCSCGEINIKKGETLLYLEGYRTYERVHTEMGSGCGVVQSMVPYIPYGRRRSHRNSPNDAIKFTDPITQHRMCQRCFEKLCRMAGLGLRNILSEKGKSELKIRPFSMTNPCSMHDRTYPCKCCPEMIPGNTRYLRIGHYDTICARCYEILSGFIGSEFST